MSKPIYILERFPNKSQNTNNGLSKIITALESIYDSTVEVNVPTIIIKNHLEEVLRYANMGDDSLLILGNEINTIFKSIIHKHNKWVQDACNWSPNPKANLT